jgi:uncharacterized protein YbjT (DUF2867 family)
MHIVLGATGHIGSAVAETLLENQEPVTIVTRSRDKAAEWERKGAKAAIADVSDVEALWKIFDSGKTLFLLNPPASPESDMVAEELKTVHYILQALEGSTIEKVVATSTYGAQQGDNIGDLGVLYEMEHQLARLDVPADIIRGAYYMSNWDTYLESARREGKLYTFFPKDFKLPMVAPQDIGRFAARLLMQQHENSGLYFFEGPEMYSAEDVAQAFQHALSKPVEVVEIPREQRIGLLTSMGFSPKSAESLSNMTDITIDGNYEVGIEPVRGLTTIFDYVQLLVNQPKSF